MLTTRSGKTTLSFTPSFRERLKMLSQENNKSMSQFIEDELSKVIDNEEQKKLKRMYGVLRKMQGTGSPGITDASTTIDETLYGEHGAWKGESER